MSKARNSTIPKRPIDTGTMIVAVGITLVIVIISAVLIVVELHRWKEFQAEIGSTSLIKTMLVQK